MNVYIYEHIPFLRLRLNSKPPINARHTDIILSVCMVTTLPQPKLPKLNPHIFKEFLTHR